jgi:hypothetical protein
MKTVVFVGICLLLAACGPAFTVAPDDVGAGDGGGLIRLASALDAGVPFVSGDASDAGEIRQDATDAGAVDALDQVEASRPIAEASADVVDVRIVDAGDAGDAPHVVMIDAGPPRPLCCATPCSGAQVADIACASSLPWTCGAGSCETAGACTAGATCHWMGTSCTGTVEVCP